MCTLLYYTGQGRFIRRDLRIWGRRVYTAVHARDVRYTVVCRYPGMEVTTRYQIHGTPDCITWKRSVLMSGYFRIQRLNTTCKNRERSWASSVPNQMFPNLWKAVEPLDNRYNTLEPVTI